MSSEPPLSEKALAYGTESGGPGHIQARLYLDRCTSTLERLLEPHRVDLLSLELSAAKHWSPKEVSDLHRSLAWTLAAQYISRLHTIEVPEDVRDGFKLELARIEADLGSKPDTYFSFADYRFKADMRILCLRRFPVGMYDLEVSGIPKRLLLRQDFSSGLRLAQVIAVAGGFAPFFTQHVAPHRISLFTPTERERFLRRTAAMLAHRTDIRGLTSTAWYNDPIVAQISPRLAYLREGWERWGHGVFRIGTTNEVTQSAIATSANRRRLFETGAYIPTAYLGVALRQQILSLGDF